LAGVAFYKKWLDAGGAIAAFFIGVVVWLAGSWHTSLPLLVFFLSGSLFSKLGKKNTGAVQGAKEHKPRDYVQVLCNGGIGTACLLGFVWNGQNSWLLAYFTSLAVSTADTWGSELGVRFDGRVVDIVGFKTLPAGISGGVSLVGTVAALAGSTTIGLCWLLVYGYGFNQIYLIVSGGFAGMLLDSILGSKLQSRYRLANGLPAEEAIGKGARLEKGLAWVTNDMVNIVSNTVVTATVVLFF